MPHNIKGHAERTPGRHTLTVHDSPELAPRGSVPGRRTLAEAQPASPVSGNGLPAPVLARMESAFGADFSDVTIHHGSEAGAVGARAFTAGSQIHFAPGEYRPDSEDGLSMIGHELTHVLQQRAGNAARSSSSTTTKSPWMARRPAAPKRTTRLTTSANLSRQQRTSHATSQAVSHRSGITTRTASSSSILSATWPSAASRSPRLATASRS